MTAADIPPSTELALLRGEVMIALSDIRGDVRLVLQSTEHGQRRIEDVDRKYERRTDELAEGARRLDERQDRLEATAVTKAELDERARRNFALAGLAVTAAGILSGAGVAVVTTLIK